jgi:uroporphyrin-3 C-methyltransferase
VEHLLRIAAQRLQLARDVESAISALGSADRLLVATADPAFLPVREVIAADLQALRALAAADHEGAAVRLNGLIRAIGSLPAVGPYGGAPEDGGAAGGLGAAPVDDWREFLHSLWADIRSLVTIRHQEAGRSPEPLLAPEQGYFLRQNLQLKLETARLALLKGDGALYETALAETGAWLTEYFDTDAAPVRAVLDTLEGLRGVKVDRELPDISDALRRLREVRTSIAGSDAGGAAGEGAAP